MRHRVPNLSLNGLLSRLPRAYYQRALVDWCPPGPLICAIRDVVYPPLVLENEGLMVLACFQSWSRSQFA